MSRSTWASTCARSAIVERPTGKLEEVELVLGEVGSDASVATVESPRSDLESSAVEGRRITGGSFASRIIECHSDRAPRGVSRAPFRAARRPNSRAVMRSRRRLKYSSSMSPANQVEARVHAFPEERGQLFRLDQHILVHRELPEVVQQGGEPQLAHLAEVKRTSGTARCLRVRRPVAMFALASETRTAWPAAVGSRWSMADAEALTKLSRIRSICCVQPRVLDRDRRLAR